MSINKRKDKLNFFIPAELEKAKSADGQEIIKIKGVCSSDDEDTDNETLIPSGFDLSRFLTDGFINYNHKAKDDASYIIGEPTKAEIINGGKQMYMEGILYADRPKAKEVYELAKSLEKNKSKRRLGYSIEGVALSRDPMNPKRVTKALITHVAITPTPKNANTYLDLIKGETDDIYKEYDEEEEEVEEKAMDTNAVAPLTKESVEHPKVRMTNGEIMKSILDRYSDIDDITILKSVFNYVHNFSNKINMPLDQDVFNKALGFIDNAHLLEKIAQGLSKSVESDTTVVEEKVVETPVSQVEEVPTEIEKSVESAGIDIETLAKSVAKECDYDHDKTVEGLIRKGISLQPAQSAAAAVIATFQAQQNGDLHMPTGIETLKKSLTEDIQKSVTDLEARQDRAVNEMVSAVNTKLADIQNLCKGLVTMVEAIEKEQETQKLQFDTLASAHQTQSESLTKALGDVDTLQKSLDTIGNVPQETKSITSIGQIERFQNNQLQKSVEAQPTPGFTRLNIRDENDKRRALDFLLNKAVGLHQQGIPDSTLEKGIRDLEQNFGASDKVIAVLRENRMELY